MYKIKMDNLPKLYEKISNTRDLFLPIKKANKVNFGLWKSESEVSIDTLKTIKSPKDIFFPQCENLYTCTTEKHKISITPEEICNKEFVVLGIRACDLRGIDVLDKVFLSEPVDTFYKARRKNGIIISMACNEPDTSCFCKAFDIDCTSPEGDIATWAINEYIYWESITEKGLMLTNDICGLLENADASEITEQQNKTKEIINNLPYMNISLGGWGIGKTEEKFNSDKWEELCKPCIACGTCTFICPTCQCYDIKDYNTGNGIQRYRCWDSCMYSDFTMMAHGNNRTTQMQRFRQRFMHKLVYFPDNNGMYACVGCGRCVDKCPSSLNIVKVIKAFNE